MMKEEEIRNALRDFLKFRGFRILKELNNNPPDMIVEKDGKLVAIEIKGSGDDSRFSRAVGQLIFTKFKYKVDDLWLILPNIPSVLSEDWVKLLWNLNVLVICISEDKFIKLTPELFFQQPLVRRKKRAISMPIKQF